ncbi:MAG: tRNA threonylcarbamoyladenosine dehydratase [Bdellovibrionota bacterium]
MPTDSTYEARFSGIGRLYGIQALEKIRTSHILIIGIGGVGSWIAESLARTGIGGLTLVDLDDVCVTNVNRQIHAISSTVGKFKVDVMKERLLEIQPYCDIDVKQCFFSPKNVEKVFDKKYDYVIDACDDFTNKLHLIDHCRKNKIPIVVMGGAGGKTDPLQIRVSDMSFSQNDRLLQRLRKKLRQEFDFPRKPDEFGVLSVWSHERAVFPTPNGCTTEKAPAYTGNMDCNEGFGSASFVTGSFAFVTTALVIREITRGLVILEKDEIPERS